MHEQNNVVNAVTRKSLSYCIILLTTHSLNFTYYSYPLRVELQKYSESATNGQIH